MLNFSFVDSCNARRHHKNCCSAYFEKENQTQNQKIKAERGKTKEAKRDGKCVMSFHARVEGMDIYWRHEMTLSEGSITADVVTTSSTEG